MNKVEWATILGCIQSSFTSFNHVVLHPDWKVNCESERLLGVSLTGICDCPDVSDANYLLDMLRVHAGETAEKWSKALSINTPKAITCVKPSGTVSQLAGTSSGCHARYAKYYLRNVQVSKSDPISKVLIESGVPHIIEANGDPVFGFPIKAEDSAITSDDFDVYQQFALNKVLRDNWCEHNVSQTIMVSPNEWGKLPQLLMENFDEIVGITFFPKEDNSQYPWKPFDRITKEEYSKLTRSFPKNINWDLLAEYEKEDSTQGSQEYACTGDRCTL